MQRFAALVRDLDASNATGDKLAALGRYLAGAPDADAAWAVYFLAGGRPRQVVPTARLRALACTMAGIDDWLFEASYQAAGDLAETIALLLPPPSSAGDDPLAVWVEQRLLPLRGLDAEVQLQRLAEALMALDTTGRFLLVKLIGGGFRVGVSRQLVQRALAIHAGLDAKVLAQRMMGWADDRRPPTAAAYRALVDPAVQAAQDAGQPYPFFLAQPLAVEPAALGPVGDWLLEWKYDGIRAQVLRRRQQVWIWSRGEELMTERFPEVAAQAMAWPDGTVLDGEILVWPAGAPRPAPFGHLQRRIGRKTLGRKLLAELPVRFLAYDLLESDGQDRRAWPQASRRAALEALLPTDAVAPALTAADWSEAAAWRAQARARGVEGLMLKQRDARYGIGRSQAEGAWWKWKLDPFQVDGVLIYAQAGHGRRAGVYTDYTFGVWNRPPVDADEAAAVVEAIVARRPPDPQGLQLVAFTKAYSGLTDAEFAAVDRVVRASTLEKFGPVRSVRPSLVIELGFEGVQRSPRHKSGVALRFPRMLRLRPDKALHEADTLAQLLALVDES